MFRKIILSAASAAALAGVYATAHAQVLVPIEIEGPLSAYTATTSTTGSLTVMNNTIFVDGTTAFVSPTDSRRMDLRPNGNPYESVTSWMRGEVYQGRRRPGLLGGTVIVTGEYNTATGQIFASEVFSDVAENVVLGVITDSQCLSPNGRCDGPTDYIRGNANALGQGGVVFIPNKDPRLTALPITDAGLFKLDLTRGPLVGTPAAPTTFGGEGYFSDDKIFPLDAVDDPLTEAIEGPTEQALVYWAFELGENRPDLLATPGIPEISVLRVRCTEGDRIEVRGFLHAPVNPDGSPAGGTDMPVNGGQGRIRVTMTINGVTQTFLDEDGDPPVADVPATYGVYRLRQDVGACGDTVNVFWDRPNGVGAPWAFQPNVPVDRLREDDGA